jgi:hypothetical protein
VVATRVTNGLTLVDLGELDGDELLLVTYADDEAAHAYTELLGRWIVGVAFLISEEGIPLLIEALKRILPKARIRREGVTPIIASSNAEDRDQPALCDCGEKIGLGTTHAFRVANFIKKLAIIGKRPGFDYIVLLPCDSCRGRLRTYARRSGVGPDQLKIILVPQNYPMIQRVVITTLENLPPFTAAGVDIRTLEGWRAAD